MADCINLLPPRVQLPVGFRFYPTDEELINHYLKNKVLGNESLVQYIPQIDTCKYEPWDLPGLLNDDTGNWKWFFFSLQDFKFSNGRRANRATKAGNWKSTGQDRKVMPRGTNRLIGTKKTLVFYHGRGRNGNRTNWVIHEYRLHLDANFAHLRPFVICRLKKKSDKTVSKFDGPNCLEDSTLENVGTANGIQKSSPLRNCTGQPALPGFQPNNASDGAVNRQSIQPGASENYFNPSELLDSVQPFNPFEFFGEATSNMFALLPEPASMDFQSAKGNDGEVNNQRLQPGTSESELNLTDYLNYVFDENNDEVTSKLCVDSHGKEERSNMGFELQYDGFSSDTDNDATFGWQNNHISSSRYHNYTSSAMQNMQTIKESRRSPLTGKRFQYREEKDDIHPVAVYHQSQSGSTVSTRSVFSYFITTKRIQHKSSEPLVYLAKAIIGMILFVVLAQERFYTATNAID